MPYSGDVFILRSFLRLSAIIMLMFLLVPGCDVEGKEGLERAPIPCGAYRAEHSIAIPNSSVVYPARVTLSCEPGYFLAGSGDTVVQCLATGHFTQGKLCSPISCGNLSVVGGVTLPRGPTLFPDTVRIVCSKGYRLGGAGSPERQCQQDGKFTRGQICMPSERWTNIKTTFVASGVSSNVRILGRNFVEGSFYQCKFKHLCTWGKCTEATIPAHVISETELSCDSPVWPDVWGSSELSILKSGMLIEGVDADASMSLIMSPSATSIHPREAAALGNQVVRIDGSGFAPGRCYRCMFQDAQGATAISEIAIAEKSNGVSCMIPTGSFAIGQLKISLWQTSSDSGEEDCSNPAAFVQEILALQGESQEPTSLSVKLVKGCSRVQPLQIGASSEFEEEISMICAGLLQGGSLSLRFSGVESHQSMETRCSVETSQVKCLAPKWKHAAEQATVSLLENGEEVHIFGEQAPVITLVSHVDKVSPQRSYVSGGTTVTVLGGGFDVSEKYVCLFACGGSSRRSMAARVVSSTSIQCVTPQWEDEPCTGQLHILEQGTFELGKLEFRIGAGVSSVSPSVVPCCMVPTPVAVLGEGFDIRSSYQCQFGVLPDAQMSPALVDKGKCAQGKCSQVLCEAPALASPGPVQLTLLENGIPVSVQGSHTAPLVILFFAKGWRAPSLGHASACGRDVLSLACHGCHGGLGAYRVEFWDKESHNVKTESCSVEGTNIVCATPEWHYQSGATSVRLFEGSEEISQAGEPTVFTFTEMWTGLSVSSGPARGGTIITVFGRGFNRLLEHTCSFKSLDHAHAVTVVGEVIGYGMILCLSPKWEHSDSKAIVVIEASGAHIPFDDSGRCSSSVGLSSKYFNFVASWASSDRVVVQYLEPFEVAVAGVGFALGSLSYSCRISCPSEESFFIFSMSSRVVDGGRLVCQMPALQKDQSLNADLKVMQLTVHDKEHGVLERSLPGQWLITFSRVALSVAWTHASTTTAPCSGGTTLTVSGFGFDVSRVYMCRWHGKSGPQVKDVTAAASFVSSVEVQCTVPAWPAATHSVRFSLRRDNNFVVRQHATNAGDIEFSFFPVWEMVPGQKAAVAGGTPIILHGSGLNPALTYIVGISSASFEEDSLATQSEALRVDAHGDIVFTAPAWKAATEHRARVSLFSKQGDKLLPVTSRSDMHVDLEYVGYWKSCSSIHGLSGSVDGGEVLTFHVEALAPRNARRFACRFSRDDTSVSVDGMLSADWSHIECVTPTWEAGYGIVRVSLLTCEGSAGVCSEVPRVSHDGLDSQELIFTYLARVESVSYSSPKPGGMTITVTGAGFGLKPLTCYLTLEGDVADWVWDKRSTLPAVAVSEHKVVCNVQWMSESPCSKDDTGCNRAPTPLPVPSTPLLFGLEDASGTPVPLTGSADTLAALRIRNIMPTWTAMSVSSGPASGGTKVTVTGCGFNPGSGTEAQKLGYVVRFSLGEIQVFSDLAKVIDASTIVFSTPEVPLEAGATMEVLTANYEPLLLDGRPDLATFQFRQSWNRVDVSQGPASGGTRVTLMGSAFHVTGKVYECVFSQLAKSGNAQKISVVSGAVVESTKQVSCTVPAFPDYAALASVGLRSNGIIVTFAGRANSNTFLFTQVWDGLINGNTRLELPADGGMTIHISGRGFSSNTEGYTCMFQRQHSEESLQAAAVMIDSGSLKCVVPGWGSTFVIDSVTAMDPADNDVIVTLVQRGRPVPLERDLDPPRIHFFTRVVSISPATFLVGRAVSVSVKAGGLNTARQYMCKLTSEQASNGQVDVLVSQAVHPTGATQLQCNFADWGHSAGHALLSVLDENGLEIHASSSLRLEFIPVCTLLHNRNVPAQERMSISISGAGFQASTRYQCNLESKTISSGPQVLRGTAIIHDGSSVECQFYGRDAWPGDAALHLVRDDATEVVWDNGQDGNTVHVLPAWHHATGAHEGPSAGGSPLVLHGAGFALTKQYSCRFTSDDGTVTSSAPAMPASKSVFECVTPAWKQDKDTLTRLSLIEAQPAGSVINGPDLALAFTHLFISSGSTRPLASSSLHLSMAVVRVLEDQYSSAAFSLLSFVHDLDSLKAKLGDAHALAFRVEALIPGCASALFASQPSIDSDGTLSFTTAHDQHGSCAFKLQAESVSANSEDSSLFTYFTVVVMSVDDSPTFILCDDCKLITDLEDAHSDETSTFVRLGAALNIKSGPPDEQAQSLTFDLVFLDQHDMSLFSQAPTLDSTGNLRFRTSKDRHGSATLGITLRDSGGQCSEQQTLTIVVEAVNDAPSFQLTPSLLLREDQPLTSWPGFAFGILPEPDPEEWQAVSFSVIVERVTPGLFKAPGPRLSSDGTLLLELSPDINGEAEVLVLLKDNGGTQRGGVDESHVQRFQVIVHAVNDPPSFSMPLQTVQVLEDAGVVHFPSFAREIRMAPPTAQDEAGQSGSFLVSQVFGPNMFEVMPSISTDGTLLLSLRPDHFGEASFSAVLRDDGGDASCPLCAAQSSQASFTMTVLAVNDAPSFSLSSPVLSVLEDSPPQHFPHFVHAISAGGGLFEQDQSLTFVVVVKRMTSTSNLFALGRTPRVNAQDGSLTFELAAHMYGEAELAVTLQDDGGLVNGGIDTSRAASLTISVTPCNDAPFFSLSHNIITLHSDDQSSRSPLTTIKGFATGITHGPYEMQASSFEVVQLGGNRRLFSVEPTIDESGTLHLSHSDETAGEASFAVRLRDNNGTENGGLDVSEVRHFHVRRLLQSTAPSFTLATTDLRMIEDIRTNQLVAQSMNAGTATGTASFRVVPVSYRLHGALTSVVGDGTTGGIFSSVPTIDPVSGIMDVSSLASNKWGIVDFNVTYVVGNVNSTIRRLRVTVQSVNDLPTFVAPASLALLGKPRQPGPVFDTYTLAQYAVNISNGGIDEIEQLISFTWNQTGGKAGVILSVDLQCEVQLPCISGGAIIKVKAGEFGTVTGTITVSDSLGKSVNQSWYFRQVTFVVPAIESPPSFYLAVDRPCNVLRSADICRQVLQVDENCECDSTYRWSQVYYQDVTLVKTFIPVATLDACAQCVTSSALRRKYVLQRFAVGSAGYAWENQAQRITFTVTESPPNGGLFNALFDVSPTISANGTLSFTLRKDYFGIVNMTVTIQDSGTGNPSFSSDLTLDVRYVNQPPTFKHHIAVVFEGTGNNNYNSIPNAVHSASPGNSFNVNRNLFDEEALQNYTFSAVAAQNGVYFQINPNISNDGTGTLTFTLKNIVSGPAGILVTLRDDAPLNPKQTTLLMTVYIRQINGAPSYVMSDVDVREGANCREQLGWFTSNGIKDWAAPSGCSQTIFGSLTQVRAGLANEECSNCLGPHAVRCVLPAGLCRQQRLAFVVDDVSDPAMFHTPPSVSAEDGALRFSLWPDVAGNVTVYMRVIDDGPDNSNGFQGIIANVNCNQADQGYCGPGMGAGRSTLEQGIDTSQPMPFVIRVLPVNDAPSITLKRDVTCLDRRDNGTCTCPSQAEGLQSNSNCVERTTTAGNMPQGIVEVLENAGIQTIHSFATDMSTSSSVSGGMAVFDFEPTDGTISYRSRRKDPILGSQQLEMAVDFAMSPGQEHVYTAEFESSTLTVLEHSLGDDKMKFVDRRGNGEHRVRFGEKQIFASQGACAAADVQVASDTWLAVGQGCQELNRSKEYIPTALVGDAMGVEPEPFLMGYLWNHTVAMWDFSGRFAAGTNARAKSAACAVSELYDTFISPSTILDRRGRFPGAQLWGMDDKDQEVRDFFCQKARTFLDAPVGEQGNVLTMMANNGVREAMQFDGKLNPGMFVSNDIDELEGVMPVDAFSVEIWFTIERDTRPRDLRAVDLNDISNAGLFSAYNGQEDITSTFKVRGFNVGYTTIQGTGSIRMRLVIGVVGMSATTVFQVIVPNFKYQTWHHMLWTYDGVTAKLFLNGAFMESKLICNPDPIPEGFTGRCPMEMPKCKWNGRTCTHEYAPGVKHSRRGSVVIGAADNRDINRARPHFGMISSVKIFDISLKPEEVAAAYNATKDVYGIVNGSTYWSKALTGSILLPSPTMFSSDVQARSEVRVRGRFNPSRKYRCRWSMGGSYVESADAVVRQATPTWGTNTSTCVPKTDAEQNSRICPNNRLICCDTSYMNELVCIMPVWPFGYAAATMTVIESVSSTNWMLGFTTLWQRTCLFQECGFLDKSIMVSTSGADIRPLQQLMQAEALWWLNGNVSNILPTALDAPRDIIEHMFGFNRGDRTFFLMHTQSYLRRLDESTGAFSETASDKVALPMALGVSSIKSFVSSNGFKLLAIANYWDGRSTVAVSPIVRVIETNPPSLSILQNLPTHGATGWTHFKVGVREFVGISNYGGSSAIFSWARNSGAVHTISIVNAGIGYTSGLVRIVGVSSGIGFIARFTAVPYQMEQPFVLPPLAGQIQPFAPYTYVEGRFVCDNPTQCATIVNGGKDYLSVGALTINDMPLHGIDPNCTAACNPRIMGANCTTSPLPLCYQRPLSEGTLKLYYPSGCADDSSACTNTEMTESITAMLVLTSATLGARLRPSGSMRIGYSNQCTKSNQYIINANASAGRVGLRALFTVDGQGHIASTSFPTAADHGAGFTADPVLVLTDGDCRCGTTITDFRLVLGGSGYSPGRIEVRGGGGAGFDAVYSVRGNVSEVYLLPQAGSAGAGFSAVPRIHTTGLSGTGAQAFAVMQISYIVLIKGGNYTVPPLVQLDAPTTTIGGITARAYAVMSAADATGTMTVETIVMIDGGLGYTSVPRVMISDAPGEVLRDSDADVAVAYAVMSIKFIRTNQDELNLAPKLQRGWEVELLRNNWHWWFSALQDSNYAQTVDPESRTLSGMSVEIDQQHTTMLIADAQPVYVMTHLCDSCTFDDVDGEYLVAKNATADPSGPLVEQLIIVPEELWRPSATRYYNFSLNDFSERLSASECMQACLLEPQCVAVDYGVTGGGADGTCWIKTLASPSPDPTWWDLQSIPSSTRSGGPTAKGCVDIPNFVDRRGLTCANYVDLRYCAANDDGSWYGPGWPVNDTFTNRSVNNVSAHDACCACGRLGAIFSSFVKVHPNVSLSLASAQDLFCRPPSSPGIYVGPAINGSGTPSDVAHCYMPFSVQATQSGALCCLDVNSPNMAFTISTSPSYSSVKLIGIDYLANVAYADGVNLAVTLETFGAAGQSIWYSESTQALAMPVVIGTIDTVTQIRRGEGYVSQSTAVVLPNVHPEYHDRTRWGSLTNPDNLYGFVDATFEYDVGFSGTIPGSFDGLVLDNLCTQSQHASGLCNRELPYGTGFGACVLAVRAHGVQLVASTAPLEMGNKTDLPTSGASGIVAFDVDGETYVAVSNYANMSKLSYLPTSTVTANAFSTDVLNQPVEQQVLQLRHTSSQVFRLSLDSTGNMRAQLVQELPSIAAYHVEVVTDRATVLLMLAQEDEMVSPLYVWSRTNGSFVLQQYVATLGARRFHAFGLTFGSIQETYVFLAQTGDARTCSLDDRMSRTPTCDLTSGSGLGPAYTVEQQVGQSAMLRWNGTMLLGNNIPTTLIKDLSGGQVFVSNDAYDLQHFEAGGKERAILVSSRRVMCEDNANWTAADGVRTCSAITTMNDCKNSRAYMCGACPKTCGTCDLCSRQLQDLQNGLCRDSADISRFAYISSSGAVLSTCGTTCQSTVANAQNCLACPFTCGLCGPCAQEIVGQQGTTYGQTRNLINESYIMTAIKQSVDGLDGISSVVVSPDGAHVYTSSYFSRTLAAFQREPTTGLLTFLSGPTGFPDPFLPANKPPICGSKFDIRCLKEGFGRPLQGIAQIAISRDGHHVYAVSYSEGGLHRFTRQVGSGLLLYVNSIYDGKQDNFGNSLDGLAGAWGVFVSHNDLSVYVAGYADQAMAAFSRDTDSGELTFVDRIKNGERVFLTFDTTVPADDADPRRLVPREPGARNLRPFVIDGQQYLAIAVGKETLDAVSEGEVTILNVTAAVSGTDSVVQRLTDELGAADVEHMYITDAFGVGYHYLAVSNSHFMANPIAVYRWSPGQKRFILFQRVALGSSAGYVRGIHYMQSSTGQHFLAVAVHQKYDRVTREANSLVLLWNNEGRTTLADNSRAWGTGFELFQRIPTRGAMDFSHQVTRDCPSCPQLLFLAVANFAETGENTLVSSEIFVYRPNQANPMQGQSFTSGPGGYFASVYTVLTRGAHSVEAFTIPASGIFIAFAERQDGYTVVDQTLYDHGGVSIYKYRSGSCRAVPCAFDMFQVIDGSSAAIGMSIPHQAPSYDGAAPCQGTALCGLPSMRGATSVKYVRSGGEHYLAVAQSMCTLYTWPCTFLPERQPQSALFQWNRGQELFTEMLAFSDAMGVRLSGRIPDAGELHLHSYALRFSAGVAAAWNLVEVPSTRGVHNTSLLLLASRTEGVVTFDLEFDVISGLNGSSKVLALLPESEYASHMSSDYEVNEFIPDVFYNLSTVPTVTVSQDFNSTSAGEHVYVAGAIDRTLVHLTRTPSFDMVGRQVADITYVSMVGESGTFTAGGTSAAADTSATPVPAGALSGPVLVRVFNDPRLDENGTLSYVPCIGVVTQQARDERQCQDLPNGECQTLMVDLTFESGNSRLLMEPPQISANGTLTFTSREFQVGRALYRVQAVDTGGADDTQYGGGNASMPVWMQIVVHPVNQQPAFVPINVFGSADAGPQELVFAVNVTPGGTLRYSELSQVDEATLFNFTFNMTVDNPMLWAYETMEVEEFINETTVVTETVVTKDGRPKLRIAVFDDRMVGIVSFEPAPQQFGIASFEVILTDSGPVSETTGSKNTSKVGYFNLTIRHINEAPSFNVPSTEVICLVGFDAPASAAPMVDVLSGLPYQRRRDNTAADQLLRFSLVPVFNITMCAVPAPDALVLTTCLNEVLTNLVPLCAAQRSCPVEASQTVSFFVVGAQRMGGNFPGSQDDLLRSGAGLFAPPSFTGTCRTQKVVQQVVQESARLQLELAAAATVEAKSAVQAKIDMLMAVTVSQDSSVTNTPDVNVGVVDGLRLEEARLVKDFCSSCQPRTGICIGVCLGCQGAPCNNNARSASFNCNGTCILPSTCSGKLTVNSPVFRPGVFPDGTGSPYFGWMDFAVLPGRFGRLMLKIAAVDDGGIEHGGRDTTVHQFVLNLFNVNRPPEFLVAKSLVVPEARKVFMQSFPQLLNVSSGQSEVQNVSFSILQVSDVQGIFVSTQGVPAVSLGPDRTLDFTLRPYANGIARVMIIARDDAGTAYGGIDLSRNFTIDVVVLPVNDPPSVEMLTEIYAVEDQGTVRAPLFATNLSKGPVDEAWQTITFTVVALAKGKGPYGAVEGSLLFSSANCTNASLSNETQQCSFSDGTCLDMRWLRANSEQLIPPPDQVHMTGAEVAQACDGMAPAFDGDGTFSFRSARDQHGSVVLSVTVKDDGGTAYGGQDTIVGGSKPVVVKVLPQPRVASVIPRYGPIMGSWPITIKGQYFGSLYSRGYATPANSAYSIDSVSVDGQKCASHTLVSDSQIVCVPARGIGAGAILVEIDDQDGVGGTRYYAPGTNRRRIGALAADAGYRQMLMVMGGTFLPANPSESDPGFLAMGPASANPGTLEMPSASAEAVPLVISRSVTSVAIIRGAVYAGGTFTVVQPVQKFDESLTLPGLQNVAQGAKSTSVVRLMRYDGHAAWTVGMGVNGDVQALLAFNGNLVVGGAFTEAYPRVGAAVATGGIAMWDTSKETWSTLGGVTFTGVVMALAAHGDVLFAGGRFDRFGTSTGGLNNVGVLQNGRWAPLGAGVRGGHVNAIAVSGCATGSTCNGTEMHVFVGGSFTHAGGLEAMRIARWDGSSWRTMGAADGDVFALHYASNMLFVGGAFRYVQSPFGVPLVVDYVAMWQAERGWFTVGDGVGGPAYSLQVIQGCLYVGGTFNKVCQHATTSSIRAQRCAQEQDPLRFQPASGVARWCLQNLTSTFNLTVDSPWTDNSTDVWEPLELEGMRRVANVRSIASFLE